MGGAIPPIQNPAYYLPDYWSVDRDQLTPVGAGCIDCSKGPLEKDADATRR
jgi:hypothetical protein